MQQIILDVGIGFGLTASQSWQVLRQINRFMNLPCELLVGHSRKSFLQHVVENSAANRDLASALIGLHLVNKVDYLRLHQAELLHELYVINSQLNY